jgi:AcrR family transcriptional regulator
MPRGPTGQRPHTKARLKDAAMAVFAERGFQAASIVEISERAGLTRGAFYSNFTTKDELFLELFDYHFERTIARMHAILDEQIEEVDPLSAISEAVSKLVSDDEQWFVVSTEFTLHAIRTPSVAEVLAGHDERFRRELVDFLRKAVERTGWSAHLDVDLDRVARLIVAVREGGLAQSLIEPSVLPHGDLDRWFIRTLLEGLQARYITPR